MLDAMSSTPSGHRTTSAVAGLRVACASDADRRAVAYRRQLEAYDAALEELRGLGVHVEALDVSLVHLAEGDCLVIAGSPLGHRRVTAGSPLGHRWTTAGHRRVAAG